MGQKLTIAIIVGFILGGSCCLAPLWADSSPHQLVITSKTFHIDRQYTSMDGPALEDKADFNQDNKHELLWITGFKAEVIDPITKASLPLKYFCHTNLQFDLNAADISTRKKAFGQWTENDFKLVSLVQGNMDVKLPEGFGIPIFSDEPLSSYSMVINPDHHVKPFDAQVKATYTYVKDSELTKPMKSLVRRVVSLRVPLTLAEQKAGKKIKCGCDKEMETELARPVLTTPMNVYQPPQGQASSYHWFVPPGKHRYSYKWGKGLKIPYDTTVHYIGLHLHPYGTYIELWDNTAKKTIFRAKAKNFKDGMGVESIEHVESIKGIPFYSTHEYEIICEYNNTSKEDVNAMAMIYLYYLNNEFDKNALQ